MSKIQESKTGVDTKKYLITIPKHIIDDFELKKGDEVKFKRKGKKVYLEFEKKNG